MEGEATKRAMSPSPHHYILTALAEANFDFIEVQLARESVRVFTEQKLLREVGIINHF